MRTRLCVALAMAGMVALVAAAAPAEALCGGGAPLSCVSGTEGYAKRILQVASTNANAEIGSAAAVGPCVLAFGGILNQQDCVLHFAFDTTYYPYVIVFETDKAVSEFVVWLVS